jgi:uncharacterized protein (TIGR02611 family)
MGMEDRAGDREDRAPGRHGEEGDAPEPAEGAAGRPAVGDASGPAESGLSGPGAGRSSAQERDPPGLIKRLRHRREAHRERGLVYRVAWVVAAVIVIAAGLVMVVFPGPALVVIPIGLAMLSLEFAWAERLLDTTLERGIDAKNIAMNASRKQKIVGIAAIVCAIGAVGAAVLIYIV